MQVHLFHVLFAHVLPNYPAFVPPEQILPSTLAVGSRICRLLSSMMVIKTVIPTGLMREFGAPNRASIPFVPLETWFLNLCTGLVILGRKKIMCVQILCTNTRIRCWLHKFIFPLIFCWTVKGYVFSTLRARNWIMHLQTEKKIQMDN